ncbi:MAG: ABC transporter substrate-binding protein [Intestinibacter sp.]
MNISIAQGTSVLDAITGANVQTQRYSVVVLKDSSYKTLSDLKGETIETVSSVDEEMLKKRLKLCKKKNHLLKQKMLIVI